MFAPTTQQFSYEPSKNGLILGAFGSLWEPSEAFRSIQMSLGVCKPSVIGLKGIFAKVSLAFLSLPQTYY